MQMTYGLIAICPYVSGYSLGARNRQAGLRCMGTPRSSSALVVSDANGDVGARVPGMGMNKSGKKTYKQ